MQLNNSDRLCVIVDKVTLMTSYTWRHIHPGLKGTTCTPRSCLPHEQVHESQYQGSVVALSVSHQSMVEFSPRIYVAYRRQAWLGPFWRQQTYRTPLRVFSPLPRDTFERFTSVLWFTDSNSLPPLTNFRVQRVQWTVNSGRRQLPGESSVIVSLSWNSQTRWVSPWHCTPLSEFPHTAFYGQCSHWDCWLFMPPCLARWADAGMIQENRHVWQAALFSPEMYPVDCWWIIYISQAEHGDLEAGVRGGN